MHNLIEYSENYLKASGILWQIYRDALVVNNNEIVDFNLGNANTRSFNLKVKLTGQKGKNVEVMVSLKYLSKFWRTFEMSLINCEIRLDLNWSEKCVLVAKNANQDTTFLIIDTKLYVLVVTLSTQYNRTLLEQSKSDFKRTINWNKYRTKISTERENKYLDFLIDPSL